MYWKFSEQKVQYSKKKTFRCYAIKLFKLFVNIFFFYVCELSNFSTSVHLIYQIAKENFQFNSISKNKKKEEKTKYKTLECEME